MEIYVRVQAPNSLHNITGNFDFTACRATRTPTHCQKGFLPDHWYFKFYNQQRHKFKYCLQRRWAAYTTVSHYPPASRGLRWSVNSWALQWRAVRCLCWWRWCQTCWPASEDFAPVDRYSTPPSRCQPEDGETELWAALIQFKPILYLILSHCIIHTTSLGM